ncbi:MAG: tripartite tricarboxylate transporter TctB family protein [Microbacterium sp.]|uniref:tripartite tricarboxylate transporter TctB family protein n=1 Tax=Microbacterium sp. TaxID=51671 RepID=UPI0027270983|nr:tripartite tricarboxylate transporter TctB family protein [Microbacterium sp.]MDO8384665.1 tripartite tricarboxylate transporter TctB family protein [Microbacterium sp.]
MPDIVISCVVLFISVGAMALSFTYPAAVSVLLPRLAAGFGIVCAVWMIVKNALDLARHRRDHEDELDSDEDLVEQEIDENDPEYVLSHTPRKIWLVTLGFIAGFFILLYLCGIFIAAAVLSFTYLVVIGKKSWLFAILYTGVFTALLWALMRWVTYISSPAGILLHGG